MNRLVLLNIARFLILLMLQVFVFNHINYVGYVNPFIFLMFVVLLPFETAGWLLLTSAFLMGLGVDLLTGSLGVHASATTLAAFLRPTILHQLMPKLEKNSTVQPGISFMGVPTFTLYTAILVFIHHLAFFTIESWSFSEIGYTLLRTLFSGFFTVLFIVLLDFIFRKK